MIAITQLSQYIQNAIANGLPGKSSQLEMSAVPRQIIDVPTPADAKKAAVLILLYTKAEKLHTVFIQRTVYKGDRHSGQISLPGGKKDRADQDLADTALRETHEEIGIAPDRVNLLGALTPLYIPISGFVVTPYVGMLVGDPVFTLEFSEVRFIIEVPISHLIDTSHLKSKNIAAPNGFFLKDVPYFEIQDHVLWGATSMIINEFIHLIKPYKKAF